MRQSTPVKTSTATSCSGWPSPRLVEIVGEAAKQISDNTRDQYPDVPWSAAARMCERLVHHYFDINLDVLWSTVTEDLPALLEQVPRPDEP